ncbi:MAG: glycosyltransferase family 2 protein [Elusimicrobia bacterium]|nr:glycosyltransferase family 2 protein [Elusimicrobiota bacterium]
MNLPETPEISLLVPIFNERRSLPRILPKLCALEIQKEIILVDDGSTDGSRQWLEEFLRQNSHPGLKLLKHPKNRGKGAALQTAAGTLRGRFCVIQDADLEYDPRYLPELLGPLKRREAEAVYGSRILSPDSKIFSPLYLKGNQLLTGLINCLCGSSLTDAYTGYKAFTRQTLLELDLQSRGFEVEAEISVKLALRGKRIVEIPIAFQARSRQEGKKICWTDAVRGLYTILGTWLGEKRRS